MNDTFGQGLRCLVVDDDDSIRLVMEETLSLAGFLVATAGSLAEARTRLAGEPFDLVVTDVNLPDGSGLSLLEELRARESDAEVIVMTAFGTLGAAMDALRAGASEFLTKPFEGLEAVRSRVRRVVESLRLRRSERALTRQLQEKIETLESLVVRDPLTGLFNHAFLQDFLEREVQRARRSGSELGLVLVDVDGFKALNDEHGHPAGDRLLQSLALLLTGRSRASDLASRLDRKDLAARFRWDVLALVLPETSRAGVATKGERVRAEIEGHDFRAEKLPAVTASVGVAVYPRDASTRSGLIDAAVVALTAAKRGGRNRMIAYTPGLTISGSERGGADDPSGRLQGLERTITSRAFRFAYQPIVDVAREEIVAYEALCRPTDPTFSSPLELIGCAEAAGRVVELGRALREVAVDPLALLPEPSLLFLNVHPLELQEGLLSEKNEPAVTPWARRIVLEITENAALKNAAHVREILSGLRARGFRIALDDLGAGYSSLNSLALVGPDFAKLDMEMLRGIRRDSRSARLIKHILEFTQEEGIRVVAEGIETEEERDVVRSLGCPLLQGYFFARPEPPFCQVTRLPNS